MSEENVLLKWKFVNSIEWNAPRGLELISLPPHNQVITYIRATSSRKFAGIAGWIKLVRCTNGLIRIDSSPNVNWEIYDNGILYSNNDYYRGSGATAMTDTEYNEIFEAQELVERLSNAR